jgi:polysaccharide biosynthesis protein PslJ
MTATTVTSVYPAGLYRTAARRTVFAKRRRFDPTWAISTYIVVLLVVPTPEVIGPLGAAGGPANMLALGCLAWWVCGRFLPGGMSWGFNPVRWAVIGFTVAMFAGYASGAIHPLDGLEIAGADRTLMIILGYAGVALLAADGIGTLEQLNRTVRRLVNLSAAFAVAGIAQFYTGFDIAHYLKIPGLTVIVPVTDHGEQTRNGLRRVVATSSHPIEYGVVLAMVLPIALHLALTAADGEKRNRWIACGIIAFACPLAVARSSILGLMVGMTMLWCGWAWPRKKAALKLAFVYLVLVRLTVHGLLGAIKSMFFNIQDDPSYQGRTADYPKVAKLVAEAPWLGHGLGTFDPRVYFILDNQYLGTLIETGYIGLLSMIALFLIALFTGRSVYRMCRLAGLTKLGDLGRAFAASMFVVTVTFVTFDALAYRMIGGMLFIVIGLTGAAWRIARIESTRLTWHPREEGDTAMRITRLTPS